MPSDLSILVFCPMCNDFKKPKVFEVTDLGQRHKELKCEESHFIFKFLVVPRGK